MPHRFPTGQERRVAVLTDCAETRAAAQDLGASLVGGREVVKQVLVSVGGQGSGEADVDGWWGIRRW